MELKLGHNIIGSYKRLSYTPWHAFAEFIDNSTQAYSNNKDLLDKYYEKEKTFLTVSIHYFPDKDLIKIRDNSIGMDYGELQNALIVGNPPSITDGRSRYGLGMKTAACWFGDKWEIITSKAGIDEGYKVEIDINRIVTGDATLDNVKFPEQSDNHYTEINITKLNRKLRGKTIPKIREFISSMYRIDIVNGLRLYWQEERLSWEDIVNKLHITEDGKPFKKNFSFEINHKKVSGWVGVLGKGNASRKNAGFSIIQAERVIEGWFKPSLIFGDQENGRNDLINQRVVGEIYLDGFAISHTKDKVIWQEDEYDQLDEKLKEVSKEAIYNALHLSYRVDQAVVDEIIIFRDQTVESMNSELRSNEIGDYLRTTTSPPEKVIAISYSKIIETVLEEQDSYIDVEIGEEPNNIRVKVFFNEKSEFEPYVVIELSIENKSVNVIINTLHPHYCEMKNYESLLNFVRHCIYDGVSEWKAIQLIGEIKPYTVKYIKDGLLRLPFEIKKNSAESILGKNRFNT